MIKWREFMLTLKENRAVVPYAPELYKAFPANKLGSRRDFPRLMSLIHVSAYLHLHDRKRDSEGRIVADPADYAEVKPLLAACFATKMEKSVRDVMRFLSRFSPGYSFKAANVMKWGKCRKTRAYEILENRLNVAWLTKGMGPISFLGMSQKRSLIFRRPFRRVRNSNSMTVHHLTHSPLFRRDTPLKGDLD